MSSDKVAPATLAPVELCKGINGLDKVVLREVRGSSAEVTLLLVGFNFTRKKIGRIGRNGSCLSCGFWLIHLMFAFFDVFGGLAD